MRTVLAVLVMFSAVWMVYRRRYKLLNTILAVGMIRRLAISASMNIPSFREKLLPELFNTKSHTN
ncbi:hypothetical protein [Oceanobacillus saliphilus]|uniref:hypothetical protein n=1 Tax=Oceanobacillus saliphilus TaxID=2925834 RepID=UPI00201D98CA|nr:hypothetical protein [Oceanobacillus saliphilus]